MISASVADPLDAVLVGGDGGGGCSVRIYNIY